MKEVLGIDVGASLSKTGIIGSDWKEEYKDFSNKVWAHDGEANTGDYDLDLTKEENVLDLSIQFEEKKVDSFDREVQLIVQEIQNQRWILGSLAEDMSSTHQTLASDSLKVVQEEFYLNILGIIYSSIFDRGVNADEIVLGVMVPPRDYFNDLKEVLFGVLNRKITIKNNTTGKSVTIHLDRENIVVKPESVVSFIACFVDDENQLTEAGETYGEHLNVSVDMGHSTTDLAIMDDFSPMKNSFKTLDVATSQLLSYFGEEIQRRFQGYTPPERELVRAFYTGKLTLGAQREWVGEELTQANRRFAVELYDSVFQYLSSHGLRFQQVASFMFSGGGSVEVKNVKSVRDFFMEEVIKVSQFTESFTPEPYLTVNNHVDYEKGNLSVVRYSNILGFVRGLREVKSTLDNE